MLQEVHLEIREGVRDYWVGKYILHENKMELSNLLICVPDMSARHDVEAIN